MKNIIERFDRRYQEIERFEYYEWTICIVFEMAIRHPETYLLLLKIFNTDKLSTGEIVAVEDKLLTEYGITEEFVDCFRQEELLSYIFQEENPTGKYENLTVECDYDSTYIDYKLNDIIIELAVKYYSNLNRLKCEEKLSSMINYLEAEGLLGKSIDYYAHKLLASHIRGYIINDNGDSIPLEKNTSIKSLDKHFIDTLNPQFLSEASQTIKLNFKRPALYFSDTKKVNVTINPILSENENMAYLLEIIKISNNGDTQAKTAYEFLGNELDKADFIVCGENKKSYDAEKILSIKEKMADLFYVYDCRIRGMSQHEIRNNIYNYYADRNIETKMMDPKTQNKYYDIAVSFIDNLRYRELITGVKNH